MSSSMPAVKVKVCGITRLEDALVAVEEGAWALGFVFHRASPRWVELEAAARIVERLPASVLTVGVFVDRPLAEVNAAVAAAGLGAAQLHGGESPEFVAQVRAGEVWKAFRVGPGFDIESVKSFPARCRVLLDALDPARPGGTGTACDWTAARRVRELRPVILAGGLNAGNVEAALHAVGPEAVDVSSGVESSPGCKDPAKLREFFAAVRRFEGGSAEGG
jgi:phosphoribosylanthranilate isomerase